MPLRLPMRAFATLTLCAFFTLPQRGETQARPRVTLGGFGSPLTSEILLAVPLPLGDFLKNSEQKTDLGIDLEYRRAEANSSTADRTLLESLQKVVANFVSFRRKQSSPRNGLLPEFCSSAAAASPADQALTDPGRFLCAHETARIRERTEASSGGTQSRTKRAQLAEALMSENWDAALEVSYQNVVGSVGRIESKADLIHLGRSLSGKHDCVGAKAATAIAYQLEVHFPDEEAIDTAKALYRYAADCGTDFAGAKAAYRLALLNVWQNHCDDVPNLMRKVEGAADANQFHSRAKYWRAYCAEVTGNADDSRNARESLLFEYPLTFHNLAANGQSDRAMRWVLRETTSPIAFRSLIRDELNNPIRIVETLVQLKASDLAAELLDRNVGLFGQAEPEIRLYLAALMQREEQPLIKFKLLSKLFQDSPRMVSAETMRLYFPLKFYDFIKSKGDHLDPLLVTALIRQESAFNSNARSRVGARGLMQLMPATARMLTRVRTSQLFDPLTNISIGTQYLRKRLNQYNGDVELTLAAYNAGFGKVDEWKRRYPTDNKILFIDLIPYRETRDYVASILRNYFWYTKIYGRNNDQIASGAGQIVDLESALNRQPAASPSTAEATIKAIMRADAGFTLKADIPDEN